ncbi:hypothetical protein RM704_39000 [Streptomyces sp. DSM 3412]|uniref:Uncharacterized protein n=1 Tax=Streptomyces gottesmaniae TaxID=3075518 RepID=A0ABU2Z9V1_9ACTN|nr:hypothetical protein [Streptomyces sp. DSM 3412]MDT0573373.1 hypothetical protein [Streptomyces sp. DSM 3412]
MDTDAAVLEQRLSRLGLQAESDEHFDRQGIAGRWMMPNTSAAQVNISSDPRTRSVGGGPST